MPDHDFVFFALTPQDYENLSTNFADVTRWITEAMWRLNYYRGEVKKEENGR